jgi:glycosyltransferase involved in cell wall biosynthesis
MKIALVVLGGLHPSGREQVVPSLLALASELAKRHDVHAFALRHLRKAHSYQINGYTVHDLGRPSAPAGLTRWAQARALGAAMTRQGPFDLVHGFWGDPAGALAVRMGRRFGIPSIATFDAGEFESLPAIDYGSQRNGRGRRAIREALGATRTHVCTEFMARKAAAHRVTPAVIPLTSVTAEHSPDTHRPMRESSVRLIQVASLSRVKNQRLLIDALPAIAADVEVHLDLAGEDTLGGELHRHAETLGVATRVTFHGFVPQDQLRPLLVNADLYVQSSLHEAAGVSVLEAAAHGLAVIGTRAGYVADWTPDRALALESPDPPAVAAAIVALHRDRPGAAAMAARARAWALERDAPWVAQRFEDLYRDVVQTGIRTPQAS